MRHGIPQDREDIAQWAKTGRGIAEEMQVVWDALVRLGHRTLCVIKFGKPGQRAMQFVGWFPGITCEHIDRQLASLLGPKYGERGEDWVLTVLNNND